MRSGVDVLSRFSDARPGAAGQTPLWLPDLTAWHHWHVKRGTLPKEWQGASLAEIAGDLGAPAWVVVRPWRVETPGVEVRVEESAGERAITQVTSAGTLVGRWSLMPDGEWWQTEYPVKSVDELPAALALIEAREYVLEPVEAARLAAEVGDAGVIALEIPRRPYSEALHTLLGWSEGLTLLIGEGRETILELLAILEEKVWACVREVAALPGDLAFAPDNLDGQFVPAPIFREHMAPAYRAAADELHRAGKRLVVHAGGPIRRLLPLLAEAGVDGVEGVAGPPQGDASLAEARQVAGPGLTLWGGIPQDFLLPTHDLSSFEAAVVLASGEAAADSRAILGVADRVPERAEVGRLRAVAGLLRS